MNRMFVCQFLMLFSTIVFAEDMVVVVSQKSAIVSMDQDTVIDAFMGGNRKYGGVEITTFDLPISPERETFYKLLTGKSVAEINSYWARLSFTGRAKPPSHTSGQDDALRQVIAIKGGIAYVVKSKVTSQVRVVFELHE